MTCRDTQAVIHTNGFCHPDPWSQVTCGVPYGYPHLSLTSGKRARWRAETNIVFCTFCHPRTASQVAGGDTLWSSAPFVNRGERIRRYQDDVGRSVLILFKIFAGFYSHRLETFKPDDARDFSLLGGDDQVRWCREVLWLSRFIAFKDTEVLLTLLMPFLSF